MKILSKNRLTKEEKEKNRLKSITPYGKKYPFKVCEICKEETFDNGWYICGICFIKEYPDSSKIGYVKT